MKKNYIIPSLRVAPLDMASIIASSPSINDGPSASPTSITDSNMNLFQMDAKQQGPWDNEW